MANMIRSKLIMEYVALRNKQSSTDLTIEFEQSIRDAKWTITSLRGYQNCPSFHICRLVSHIAQCFIA